MSNVIKKCPKDGLVYIATYSGKCEQCFTDLQFYCKVHNAWLTGDRCDKCDSPSAVTPTTPAPVAAPAKSRGDFWLVLFFVGCLVVLAASVTVIWRIVARRQQPTASKPVIHFAPTPPVATPPKPAPVVIQPIRQPPPPAPVATPVELSLKDLLGDPDPYLGKFVKTRGSVAFIDTGKETFDLRQGDYTLQVRYRATLALGQDLTVVGVLNRDEELNAVYLSAQLVTPR